MFVNLYHLSQRMTKPTVRLVQLAKTRSAGASLQSYQDLLIACAFFSLWAIQTRMKENRCHTGWMYRLIRVFAGHIGLIIGFVMR